MVQLIQTEALQNGLERIRTSNLHGLVFSRDFDIKAAKLTPSLMPCCSFIEVKSDIWSCDKSHSSRRFLGESDRRRGELLKEVTQLLSVVVVVVVVVKVKGRAAHSSVLADLNDRFCSALS